LWRLALPKAIRELIAGGFAAAVGKVRQTAKETCYYWLLSAESHLTRRLFGSLFGQSAGLPPPVG